MKAGVAVVNQLFDPDVPYSEAVFSTAPQRICSYDKTRMEIDCTCTSKGFLKEDFCKLYIEEMLLVPNTRLSQAPRHGSM
jgi:hypothetical protein